MSTILLIIFLSTLSLTIKAQTRLSLMNLDSLIKAKIYKTLNDSLVSSFKRSNYQALSLGNSKTQDFHSGMPTIRIEGFYNMMILKPKKEDNMPGSQKTINLLRKKLERPSKIFKFFNLYKFRITDSSTNTAWRKLPTLCNF